MNFCFLFFFLRYPTMKIFQTHNATSDFRVVQQSHFYCVTVLSAFLYSLNKNSISLHCQAVVRWSCRISQLMGHSQYVLSERRHWGEKAYWEKVFKQKGFNKENLLCRKWRTGKMNHWGNNFRKQWLCPKTDLQT